MDITQSLQSNEGKSKHVKSKYDRRTPVDPTVRKKQPSISFSSSKGVTMLTMCYNIPTATQMTLPVSEASGRMKITPGRGVETK